MSSNYMAVYFPETLEFTTMCDERGTGFVGKRLFITYDDRPAPYEGIVKGVYKSEEEASTMIERWTVRVCVSFFCNHKISRMWMEQR